MINSKQARAESDTKNSVLRVECEGDLDAAIRAATALGHIELRLYKPHNRLVIMQELANANGFQTAIMPALDQRDTDYLIVRW